MRELLIAWMVPVFVAAAAGGALVVWLAGGEYVALEKRVPGRDVSGLDIVSGGPVELVGKLQTTGHAADADLPGAWPRFRGEASVSYTHLTLPTN